MRKNHGWAGVLLLVSLLACKKETGASGGGGLAGEYEITAATNPGGRGSYQGRVSITQTGDVFQLRWTIPNAPPYSGVALQEGDLLGVGWGVGNDYGVAVYRVEGGKLSGRFSVAGAGKVGTETLEGPPGLNGEYKIVEGKSPDGKPYTGTATITPAGAVHSVSWTLPSSSFSGTGILEGDRFVVGWGEAGKGAGVVSYRVSGNTLTGRWGQPGTPTLGTESLARK